MAAAPNIRPMTLEADSLQKSEDKYDSMSGKSLDYGQVKVIVLGNEVVADREKLQGLLEEIRENTEFARTMLVCESLTTGEDMLALDRGSGRFHRNLYGGDV